MMKAERGPLIDYIEVARFGCSREEGGGGSKNFAGHDEGGAREEEFARQV